MPKTGVNHTCLFWFNFTNSKIKSGIELTAMNQKCDLFVYIPDFLTWNDINTMPGTLKYQFPVHEVGELSSFGYINWVLFF